MSDDTQSHDRAKATPFLRMRGASYYFRPEEVRNMRVGREAIESFPSPDEDALEFNIDPR